MSGSKAQNELKVPDGMNFNEDEPSDYHAVLHLPGAGYATLDWQNRCYRAGVTTTSQRMTNREYKGMGWRQRPLDDAAAWLGKIGSKKP